ncbi:MAG: NUDIX hydrolase [Actinomycetota bacterium]|nr:NUDIX hydrolase [Actinomycetota bacterium]
MSPTRAPGDGPEQRPGAARPAETLKETSYGGAVVRPRADGHELLVIVPRGTRVVGLPKGGASPGETPEETAVREVREETGTNVSIREPLGEVSYWYRRHGRRIFKTVHFFLCDYLSGDTADHDHEVDEARWMPLEAATTQLSYPAERQLARLAQSKLAADR